MKKLFRKIGKSITAQIVIITISILLIMIVMLMQIFIYFKRVEENNAAVLSNTVLTQTESSLGAYYDSLEGTAESFGYSSAALRFFQEEPLERIRDIKDLKNVFSNTILLEKHIRGIKLYDTQMNLIASFGRSYDLPAGEKRLRNVIEMNMDNYIKDSDEKAYAFYLPEYNVHSGDYSELLGMCVFFLDRDALNETILNSLSALSCAVEIDDQNGEIIAFQQTSDLNQTSIANLTRDGRYNSTNGIFRKNGWKIYTAVSIEANAGNEQTYLSLIILTVVIMAAALTLLILFNYLRLAMPVQRITRFIEKATGNPSLRLNSKRLDEIGKVSRRLDKLLDENQRSMHEIRENKIMLYELELSQQKMELLAYRNQINPHFLYNTFACISGMALMNDEEEIAEITMALSDIFRYAVKGGNIVTVSDEVENLKKYRKIIEARFMEDIETHTSKINISIDVEDDTLDMPVPKLLIQPLVENSVFHGLEQKMGHGNVNIRIYHDLDRVRIMVSDDGEGVGPDRLRELKASYEKKVYVQPDEAEGRVPEFMRPVNEVDSTTDISVTGDKDVQHKSSVRDAIGLGNIIQRLRLFYGASYTFTIDSAVNRGTEVRISISDRMSSRVMENMK